jgi:RHS repeat-associated protein
VWRWDQQEPFGNNVPDENPSGLGAFDLPLRLPGQYFDKETNLHYNYFRDYDPVTARYAQSDPIGLRGGTNTYIYAVNDPVKLIDAFGLDSCGGEPTKCWVHEVSCQEHGGIYNYKCDRAGSIWRFRTCTYISTCFPFIWASTLDRCAPTGGGLRG